MQEQAQFLSRVRGPFLDCQTRSSAIAETARVATRSVIAGQSKRTRNGVVYNACVTHEQTHRHTASSVTPLKIVPVCT